MRLENKTKLLLDGLISSFPAPDMSPEESLESIEDAVSNKTTKTNKECKESHSSLIETQVSFQVQVNGHAKEVNKICRIVENHEDQATEHMEIINENSKISEKSPEPSQVLIVDESKDLTDEFNVNCTNIEEHSIENKPNATKESCNKNEAENEIEEVSEILNKSGNGNKISNQIEEIEIESPDLSPAPVVDEPEEQIDEVLSEVEEIFSTANSGNVTAKDVLNEKIDEIKEVDYNLESSEPLLEEEPMEDTNEINREDQVLAETEPMTTEQSQILNTNETNGQIQEINEDQINLETPNIEPMNEDSNDLITQDLSLNTASSQVDTLSQIANQSSVSSVNNQENISKTTKSKRKGSLRTKITEIVEDNDVKSNKRRSSRITKDKKIDNTIEIVENVQTEIIQEIHQESSVSSSQVSSVTQKSSTFQVEKFIHLIKPCKIVLDKLNVKQDGSSVKLPIDDNRDEINEDQVMKSKKEIVNDDEIDFLCRPVKFGKGLKINLFKNKNFFEPSKSKDKKKKMIDEDEDEDGDEEEDSESVVSSNHSLVGELEPRIVENDPYDDEDADLPSGDDEDIDKEEEKNNSSKKSKNVKENGVNGTTKKKEVFLPGLVFNDKMLTSDEKNEETVKKNSSPKNKNENKSTKSKSTVKGSDVDEILMIEDDEEDDFKINKKPKSKNSLKTEGLAEGKVKGDEETDDEIITRSAKKNKKTNKIESSDDDVDYSNSKLRTKKSKRLEVDSDDEELNQDSNGDDGDVVTKKPKVRNNRSKKKIITKKFNK